MKKGYYRKYCNQRLISIGNSSSCDIQFLSNAIESFHAEIDLENRMINSPFNPYLLVDGERRTIFNWGSKLQLFELVLIPMPQFLMVMQVPQTTINLSLLKVTKPQTAPYSPLWYSKKKVRFLTAYPACDLKFKSICELSKPHKTSLLISIAPTLLMSVAALLSGGISAYNGYQRGSGWQEVMPMMILPMVMIFSILLIHPLQKYYEKKRNNDLLLRRNKKIENSLEQVTNQLEIYKEKIKHCDNQRFFSMEKLSQWLVEHQQNLFFKEKQHDDFLKIGLGFGKIESGISFSNLPNDEDCIYYSHVQKIMSEWEFLYERWIFLDLKVTSCLAIVDSSELWFNFILMQLVIYHDPRDIEINFIATQQWIFNHSFIYGIPHSKNDDGTRNIITNYQQFINLQRQKNNKKKIYFIQDTSILNAESIRDDICFFMVKEEGDIPFACQSYLLHSHSTILVNENGKTQINFVGEKLYNKNVKEIAQCQIERKNQKTKKTLFDLFQVEDAKSLNIFSRWNKEKTELSVPIAFGDHEQIFNLNLHENQHGPHMMIGATTGAGKSEFLITFLTSLMINFSYTQIQYVIIDFKGGGLADSFKHNNKVSPHCVGVLTNLDDYEIARVLVSFRIECKRRQILFAQLKKLKNLSAMNIDLYIQYWDKSLNLDYLPHLFVVVDEFAELRQQAPEFIDELISVARLGRSLGIHLILATQKPSTVVSPEIWSNVRCKVCLRVQEKQDSFDMLQSDKAFYLSKVGEFYCKVDQKEYHATCAWSNASSIIEQDEVALVDEQGVALKKYHQFNSSQVTQLSQVLEIINGITLQEKPAPLWLSPLDKLEGVQKSEDGLVLGKVDNYYEKKQEWLTHQFEQDSHGLFFSLSSDEKHKMILTILTSLSFQKRKVTFIDSSSNFEYINKINRINYINLKEDIKGFFKNLIITFQSNKNPHCVIISHFPQFSENQQDWIYNFEQLLRDGPKYQLHFLIFSTTATTIPYRWISYFGQRYCLAMKQKDEICAILNSRITFNEVKLDFGLVSGNPIMLFRILNVSEKEMLDAWGEYDG
ncbi:MAG: FtsK/SpoIIIE domain-containing protein [Anaerorhabdus sp.]